MLTRTFFARGVFTFATAVAAFAGAVSPVSAGPAATPSATVTCNVADSTDIVGGDFVVATGLSPDTFPDASITLTVTNGGRSQVDYIGIDRSSGGYWETKNSSSGREAFLLGVTSTRKLTLLNDAEGAFQPTLRKTQSWRLWFSKVDDFYHQSDTFTVAVHPMTGSAVSATCTAP